jgi:hypothetical protein
MWEALGLERLIEEHRSRHAAMAVQDVYKLLYQGVLGPEHLVASAEGFAARLRAEYEAVPTQEEELLWEAVRPDGELVRVNLRPFKARGGDVDKLIAGCLQTAAQPWGTVEELRAAWACFVALGQSGRWSEFPAAEALALTAWLEEQGWPALHHSAGYREANWPAYRVIMQTLRESVDSRRV